MKTAMEKAIEVLAISPIEELTENEYAILAGNIKLVIEIQDKHTRHACAESVIEIDEGGIGGEWKDAAFSACINVKVV